LVAALDERLGDPVDAYVNGSQTWLVENGPRGMTLEWRLHPVAGYERPAGTDTYRVFRDAAEGKLDPAQLWDGLETFVAYDDPTTAADLRAAATAALGREPDAWGVVDHDAIGDEWETTSGAISIIERLIAQLRTNREG
jgi:hypothetical protein